MSLEYLGNAVPVPHISRVDQNEDQDESLPTDISKPSLHRAIGQAPMRFGRDCDFHRPCIWLGQCRLGAASSFPTKRRVIALSDSQWEIRYWRRRLKVADSASLQAQIALRHVPRTSMFSALCALFKLNAGQSFFRRANCMQLITFHTKHRAVVSAAQTSINRSLSRTRALSRAVSCRLSCGGAGADRSTQPPQIGGVNAAFFNHAIVPIHMGAIRALVDIRRSTRVDDGPHDVQPRVRKNAQMGNRAAAPMASNSSHRPTALARSLRR